MILTPGFVYIHLPKTGGTFVTSVLERVLKPPRPATRFGRFLRRLRGRTWHDTNKRGTVSEIPPSHRGLPVLTTIRNPFDRCVSQYEFAWWKERTREWVDREAIRREFPSFPDLSFPEFVEASARHFPLLRGSPLPPERRLGYQSEQFVRTYFRDPAAAWSRIDDAWIAARGWEGEMGPIRFLRMEHLNADLHAFLREQGLPADRIDFVLTEGRILPAGPRRPEGRTWESWYTPELRARVRERERLLFALFPEYDAP